MGKTLRKTPAKVQSELITSVKATIKGSLDSLTQIGLETHLTENPTQGSSSNILDRRLCGAAERVMRWLLFWTFARLDDCPSWERRLPLKTFARQSFARLDVCPSVVCLSCKRSLPLKTFAHLDVRPSCKKRLPVKTITCWKLEREKYCK